MRKWILLLIPLLMVMASGQNLEGYVNDYADVLSAQEEQQITSILQDIDDSNNAQYAIVIIDSLEGRDIEGYALEIAQGNLGDESNNGLLLLVAVEDREYRFEIGRGLEPTIPDIVAGRIGREYLVPYFRQGDYGEGILAASQVIHDIVVEGEVLPENSPAIPLGIIITVVVLFIIFIVIASRNKPKRESSDYYTAAWIASQILKGGKGGSGGFGGFGGGSFGGGGASGGW